MMFKYDNVFLVKYLKTKELRRHLTGATFRQTCHLLFVHYLFSVFSQRGGFAKKPIYTAAPLEKFTAELEMREGQAGIFFIFATDSRTHAYFSHSENSQFCPIKARLCTL